MGKNDYVPAVIGLGVVGVAAVGLYLYKDKLLELIGGAPVLPDPTVPDEDPTVPGEETDPSTGIPVPPTPATPQCSDLCQAGDCATYAKQCTKCCSKCNGCGSSTTYRSRRAQCHQQFKGSCNLECAAGCTSQTCIDCHKACGGRCTGVPNPACSIQLSGNCAGDCNKTCWTGAFNGTLKSACVEMPFSTPNCQLARTSFCTTYGPCAAPTAAAYTRARVARRVPSYRSYRALANGWTS